MAYAARSSSGLLEENRRAEAAAKQAANKTMGPAAGTRRALGEIGNVLSGALTSRASKEQAAKKASTGALTERNAGGTAGGRDVGLLLNRIRESAKRSAAQNAGTAWTKSRSSSFKASSPSSLQGRTHLDGAQSLSRLLQQQAEECEDPLPDIDSHDRNNPLAATEYVNSMYSYYHRVEPETRVDEKYMQSQADINDKMRAILIDWLVEVHLKFKLMPETLFLTTNLIDRFLAKKSVSRKNLQLVGVTAMLLASKYEEIWAPEVRDFVYISDKAYNREQILAMEKQMLNTLNFQLTVPTVYHFMARSLKASTTDKQHSLLSSFLVELSLIDYSMLKHPGSLLAAAAVYTANRITGKQAWNNTLARHSRYTEEQLVPVSHAMARLMRKASTASLTAVHKKYSNPKFLEVAKLPVPSELGNE
mmetsp:Transcript_25366/g.86868  ORF Transcript_25366/g.86868 Transcript_25366/m.86868 type:complete len:420 (+) Transcript_25366:157-1416(+)|eukprot:CAMPEP_0183809712 /NCGR_PEP_ID=MMETSP0803_2-20130417/45996_1 /TAXON_ID=195967 /ORGANISM="Crustomastix stigmata, Strain CCMP3273" /LENGTH=419 /DNA_ID=CAMNT_0026054521 /DNA_START=152 /DNA_END=1411 /DNA_ORIENTATION=+